MLWGEPHCSGARPGEAWMVLGVEASGKPPQRELIPGGSGGRETSWQKHVWDKIGRRTGLTPGLTGAVKAGCRVGPPAHGAGHNAEQRTAPWGFSREPHGVTDFPCGNHRPQHGRGCESAGKGRGPSWRAGVPRRSVEGPGFLVQDDGVGLGVCISAGGLRRPGFPVGMSGVKGHPTPKACAGTPPLPREPPGVDREGTPRVASWETATPSGQTEAPPGAWRKPHPAAKAAVRMGVGWQGCKLGGRSGWVPVGPRRRLDAHFPAGGISSKETTASSGRACGDSQRQ